MLRLLKLKENIENLESDKLKLNADINAMESKYVDIIEQDEEVSWTKSETIENLESESMKLKAENNALKFQIDSLKLTKKYALIHYFLFWIYTRMSVCWLKVGLCHFGNWLKRLQMQCSVR